MIESRYYVWCENEGPPKKMHEYFASAKQEALRLCNEPENIGKEYVILRAVMSFKYATNPIIVTQFCKNG